MKPFIPEILNISAYDTKIRTTTITCKKKESSKVNWFKDGDHEKTYMML